MTKSISVLCQSEPVLGQIVATPGALAATTGSTAPRIPQAAFHRRLGPGLRRGLDYQRQGRRGRRPYPLRLTRLTRRSPAKASATTPSGSSPRVTGA